MSQDVLVQNETFTMTGDSIFEDTLRAGVAASKDRIECNINLSRLDSLYNKPSDSLNLKFVQGRVWHKRKSRPALMPKYSSNQPLVDALYDMSAERIADAVGSNGQFTPGSNLSRLYCAIFLSLAALKPHQSMATLRSMVDRDSIIMQREGQWPVVSDHIGWATAAWEVYKITGDRQWLSYSHHVIEKTLNINHQVLFDHELGLVHGAGYTLSRPIGARRMTWMSYNDLFGCMALGNNILTAHAYWILSEMGEELGLENDYAKTAQRLKDAINQHLWNEDKGFYCSFLYGIAIPRQSPLTDNTSQAMSVLWSVADDDRAEYLISQTPVSDQGINVTYPASTAIEPFFVNSSWATTQALWNLAAASVGNENAVRRGLGALYRAQALYQSRGIHLEGINTDELGTSASNAAMALRVLAGMRFTPQGIEFAPLVPQGLNGKKSLKGFNYRRAVIDVIVDGCGNEVQSITDNGNAMESTFLPNDIEGHHEIIITLKENRHMTQRVTIHHNEVILPPTPNVVWSADSGHIVDYIPGASYRLSINGKLTDLKDSLFRIPTTEEFTEYSVEIAGKYINGYMSQPHMKFSLTPQIAFLTDSTDGHNTVKVRVSHGGDYLIDIGYLPIGTLDVREIEANGHLMGTLVMSASSDADDKGLAYSNIVRAKLLKGDNVIVIRQIRLPKSFTSCKPVHMRVIQR